MSGAKIDALHTLSLSLFRSSCAVSLLGNLFIVSLPLPAAARDSKALCVVCIECERRVWFYPVYVVGG